MQHHLSRSPADSPRVRRPVAVTLTTARFAARVAGTAALLTVAGLGGVIAEQTGAATLRMACASVVVEYQLCKKVAKEWGVKTGNTVEITITPKESNNRLAMFNRMLSSQSDEIDVLQLDVIWPGILGHHLLDLTRYAENSRHQHLPAAIANNTLDGRLIAMPWSVDFGVLYYRRDLLEKYNFAVPETWEQLTHIATTIQAAERAAGHKALWGYVWQGSEYEGLTCNALEWIASSGGGMLIDASGQVTVNNPAAVAALTQATAWVGSISPRAVLNYNEEGSRMMFQRGDAVFMRGWPYAWSLLQQPESPIAGRVGITAIPYSAGAKSSPVLGGSQLAVSRYSRHPALAAELVMYLTSYKVQKQRMVEAALNPTMPALYKDRDVVASNPFVAELWHMLPNAVARPSTVTKTQYNQVSNLFWSSIHSSLSGRITPQQAIERLARTVPLIAPEGKWR